MNLVLDFDPHSQFRVKEVLRQTGFLILYRDRYWI